LIQKSLCRYNASMHKRFILVFWLFCIIFPMAWLGRFSPRYQGFFNKLFSPEWIHWVMHAAIYAGLTLLVMFAFDLAPSRGTLGIIFSVVLITGIVQESLQLFSGVQVLRWNTFLDLIVDSVGALLGYGLGWGWRTINPLLARHKI